MTSCDIFIRKNVFKKKRNDMFIRLWAFLIQKQQYGYFWKQRIDGRGIFGSNY